MAKRTLGDFVSEILDEIERVRGWNQGQVAAELLKSAATVSNWRRNVHPPDWGNLQDLLNLLRPAVNVADCLRLPDAAVQREEIRAIVQEELKTAIQSLRNEQVAHSPPVAKPKAK